MNELMERLARANPVPPDEPPTAADQRDADALLERVLATPEAPPAPRRPLVRRVAPAAALLAIVVVAAVVVIDLVGSEDDGGGIVDRALAAVSQEDVIYAVTERRTSTSRPLTPGLEVSPDEREFVRYWLWPGDQRSRFLMYDLREDGSRGRLQSEFASDSRGFAWFMADSNTIMKRERSLPDSSGDSVAGGFPGFSPFSDPGSQLRALVDESRLRVAGRTTVRGRNAYRLVSKPRDAKGIQDEQVTYLVDARTFLPLEMRVRVVFVHDDSIPGGGGRELARLRIEYLRYEPLPVTDENRALLEMGDHPGARVEGGP
jgi:hypothetical protein